MNTVRIYHIVETGQWSGGAENRAPDPWEPVSLRDDGFIHCSFHQQVAGTLRTFFTDQTGNLVEGLSVLEIDPFLTDAVIRAEPGTDGETDLTGAPELFPHLYGPLPRRAVTAVCTAEEFLPFEVRIGDYLITDDPRALSVDVATEYLSEQSYWAEGRSRETVAVSVRNAWVLTLVAPDGAMAGMARVITDWATMYYVSDLFVLPPHRGRGLGRAIVRAIVERPDLQPLKGILRTKDAHSLYAEFGFERDGPESSGMRRQPPG